MGALVLVTPTPSNQRALSKTLRRAAIAQTPLGRVCSRVAAERQPDAKKRTGGDSYEAGLRLLTIAIGRALSGLAGLERVSSWRPWPNVPQFCGSGPPSVSLVSDFVDGKDAIVEVLRSPNSGSPGTQDHDAGYGSACVLHTRPGMTPQKTCDAVGYSPALPTFRIRSQRNSLAGLPFGSSMWW
jgi:hypothetical protein